MTQQQRIDVGIGALALVGSGEYLPVLNDTDTYLLNTLGGAKQVRIALLPTASGLEGDRPEYWNALGFEHFKQLGVQDVRVTSIIDRSGAVDPEQLALLQDANFYYFSGGNPRYLLEVLRDTPAWKMITRAHQRGAVLAGCSAGAMVLGSLLVSPREVFTDQPPNWLTALSLVPNIVVFPHFDRIFGNTTWATGFDHIFNSLPAGYQIIGIDENTALVRVQVTDPSAPARWQVMGAQTVTLFDRDGSTHVFQPGNEVLL